MVGSISLRISKVLASADTPTMRMGFVDSLLKANSRPTGLPVKYFFARVWLMTATMVAPSSSVAERSRPSRIGVPMMVRKWSPAKMYRVRLLSPVGGV